MRSKKAEKADPPILILEEENNRRGDLFGRLMVDLFLALGYEQAQLNIHKPGRELDLSANHRLETRRAIAECKATSSPIGGDDLNKFLGALSAERGKKKRLTGYFISLAGFTEPAKEQEKQRPGEKVVLLSGTDVIRELITGRILISRDRATELAGQARSAVLHLQLDPAAQLLAHQRGWIWAVYYLQGKARTHVVLIHADGTPLARPVANDVIAAERRCGGRLHTLTCLNEDAVAGTDKDPALADALASYRRYLENECGFIQLDGLPADGEVGPRRLQLEDLFVPLHLDIAEADETPASELHYMQVGLALARFQRIALLAAPGCGKSTLIKRLAMAYADPERRRVVPDNLPERDWLPLFFRCRELRDLARGSFAALLQALSQREPVRQYADLFRAHVDRALLTGRVLMLVDGLDEISDPGDRAAFVCTLRTTLQAYPGISLVVTSREAGFRHVAAHLAPVCTHATLSPFTAEDIHQLTMAWYREVAGDTEKVRADAEDLAAVIVDNERIESLAVNPLLLTTLLLVKRWVGSLPTRRAVLYGKAVEVLLMTWNTEGHEPIPEEEALPQLCYIASAMMLSGVQKISRPRLAALIKEAREALPTELSYVRDTVDQFIHRVEDRSSLLTMTGLDIEDGRLVEFFEFRHLTFQEFLTARGMVEGWYPDRQDQDRLADVLQPHFAQAAWREVIALAAVLAGRATENLIQSLTAEATQIDPHSVQALAPFQALGHCLADEAAVRPETIRAALKQIIRMGKSLGRPEGSSFGQSLATGRYGSDFRQQARAAFLSKDGDIETAVGALEEVVLWQIASQTDSAEQLLRWCAVRLRQRAMIDRCEGALVLMRWCYGHLNGMDLDSMTKRSRLPLAGESDRLGTWEALLREAADLLTPMAFSTNLQEQYSACWALAWLGVCQVWAPPAEPDLLGRLFVLWQCANHSEIRRLAVWALSSQCLAPHRDDGHCSTVSLPQLDALIKGLADLDSRNERPAVLIVAWYRQAVSDVDLVELCHKAVNDHESHNHSDTMGVLGELATRAELAAAGL